MKFSRYAMAALAAVSLTSTAHAQVFEVVHPDATEGGFEFEFLHGVVLDGIGIGEERSVHEVALAYAPVSFWKTTLALELATTRGAGSVFEAVEWGNLFLLPIGDGHDHDHDHDHDEGGFLGLHALGLFVGLEVPTESGIRIGGVEVGPTVEFNLGPVETVANLFVEIPFEDGVDPGLTYALSAALPVGEVGKADFAAGLEAFGGVEELFGNGTPLGQNSHLVGPAMYAEFDIGGGQFIEPRLAILFGVSNGAPDAVLSLNFEFKY